MADAAAAIAAGLDADGGDLVACALPDSPELVALMLGAALSNSSLVNLGTELPRGERERLQAELSWERCIDSSSEVAALIETGGVQSARDTGRGELLVLTSGTTGQPKCARYSWDDLLAQIPAPQEQAGSERWLLAYRLSHFAGVQMLLHVLLAGQSLAIPLSARMGDALEALGKFRVSHLSSTPTFWRFALAAMGDALPPLRQITLGSEAVPQSLLTGLAQKFPAARIVHIYATTELGSCVSVSDGRAGLPATILQRGAGAAIQFRIEEDELWVRSRHGMQAYVNEAAVAGEWRATGDLVRLEGDRIHFLGRRSETINVGGVKVFPREAEECIAALPEVKLVRAYGRENPVTGQIVAVDIVLQDGCDPDIVEERVFEVCRDLSRHSQPRSVNFVDELATRNMKLERR